MLKLVFLNFPYFALISDQDSVRLLSVEGCAALGKLLEPQDCVAHILPVIVNFSQVILSVKHIGFYANDP